MKVIEHEHEKTQKRIRKYLDYIICIRVWFLQKLYLFKCSFGAGPHTFSAELFVNFRKRVNVFLRNSALGADRHGGAFVVLRTFVFVDNQFHNMLLFINTGNVRLGNQLNPQCPVSFIKRRQLLSKK